MVNTIGELEVSLTITRGSDLHNLHKQLETLVGPKGKKTPEISVDIDPTLYRRLDEIQYKINWLLPVGSKSQQKRDDFIKETAIIAKDLIKFKEDLVDRLGEIDPKYLESLMDEWGLDENATDEDIREMFTKYVDEIIDNISYYADHGIVNNKVESVKTLAKNFLNSINTTTGENLSLLRKLMEKIGENQTLWEKMLSELGALEKGQKQFYGLKNDIEKIFKDQLKETGQEEFDKWKNITINKLPTEEKTKKWKEALDTHIKDIGKEVKPIEFIDYLREQGRSSEDIEEAIKSFFRLTIENKLQDFAVDRDEWINIIKPYFDDVKIPLDKFRYLMKVDISLIKDKVDELRRILPDDFVDKIADKTLTELKMVFTKKDIDQIQQRVRFLGGKVFLLTSMIPSHLKKEVEGLGMEIGLIPNVRGLYQELIDQNVITQEKLDDIIKKLEEKVKVKNILDQIALERGVTPDTEEDIIRIVGEILKKNNAQEILIEKVLEKLQEIGYELTKEEIETIKSGSGF